MMNDKFILFNQQNEINFGSVVAPNPKTAARRILSYPLAKKGIDLQMNEIEVTPVDDITFQITVLGEKYILKKVLEKNS